jgi:hypothetical protein
VSQAYAHNNGEALSSMSTSGSRILRGSKRLVPEPLRDILLWHKVNFPCTHVATTVRRTREPSEAIVQKLWKAGTEELLWTHKQATPPDIVFGMFPRFTPNGDRVGFFDGEHIIILDVLTPIPVELERIHVESEVPDSIVYSFALGPGARSLALAASIDLPLKRITGQSGRPIDIIPGTPDERMVMYYTLDAQALYCASHNTSSGRLEMTKFDLDGRSLYQYKVLENVDWVAATHLVQWHCAETGFATTLRYKREDAERLGIGLTNAEGESVQVCSAILFESSKIASYVLGAFERMVMRHGQTITIDYLCGTVSLWGDDSPLPVRIASFVSQDLHNEVFTAVAFNMGRLTFISKDGKFIFVDTISEGE